MYFAFPIVFRMSSFFVFVFFVCVHALFSLIALFFLSCPRTCVAVLMIFFPKHLDLFKLCCSPIAYWLPSAAAATVLALSRSLGYLSTQHWLSCSNSERVLFVWCRSSMLVFIRLCPHKALS